MILSSFWQLLFNTMWWLMAFVNHWSRAHNTIIIHRPVITALPGPSVNYTHTSFPREIVHLNFYPQFSPKFICHSCCVLPLSWPTPNYKATGLGFGVYGDALIVRSAFGGQGCWIIVRRFETSKKPSGLRDIWRNSKWAPWTHLCGPVGGFFLGHPSFIPREKLHDKEELHYGNLICQ